MSEKTLYDCQRCGTKGVAKEMILSPDTDQLLCKECAAIHKKLRATEAKWRDMESED